MKVLTCEQMRAVEQAAVDSGMDYLRLMENAGSAAARLIRSRYPMAGRTVAVLCGRGNNGGDGFVIARKLRDEGAVVSTVLVGGAPSTDEAREMLSRIERAGISLVRLETEPYVAANCVREASLIVDAVYGIGFHGRLPDFLRSLFRTANGSPAPRVAIDVPSGMNADTGAIDEDALRCSLTITFTAMKTGLTVPETAEVCGEIAVADIGIDPSLVEPYGNGHTVIDWPSVRRCFPPRDPESHKGTYGRLLSLCGSEGMLGAAMLSAHAALRCGVGLMVSVLPRSLYPIAASRLPEPVYCLLDQTADGDLSPSARPLLREQAKTASAVLIGCGLGLRPGTRELVEDLLMHADCPIVLDADGINAAAVQLVNWKTVRGDNAPSLVLTPHPGEMARLTGSTVAEIQADRDGAARRLAEQTGATVVLKGRRTVIASPGTTCLVNPTGNPGMATGGSGDVLAGMIASFLAQGMRPRDAAMCGVYLHGLAGDKAAERLSQHAMLPSDLIGELSGLFSNIENGS